MLKVRKIYNLSLPEFKKMVHSKKNTKKFQQETDCDDWEFAFASLNWWETASGN
jgi:hypothetical protein